MFLQKNSKKQMITSERIYKIMQWLPIVVASIFFLINVIKLNTAAMIVIGFCLVMFTGIAVVVKVKQVSLYKRELIMSLMLPTLVFMISLFSGASYSDDFPLFLAVIGLTGMFLEPQITKAQVVLADTYLVIMYFVHPEKSGGTSQYILCGACFTLAAVLIYQVIKRGRAFIEMSEEKAKEAQGLLESIREMGAELQADFEASSGKVEQGTVGLRKESDSITRGSGMVLEGCSAVQGKLIETREQIRLLNEEVRQFESALSVNKENMDTMEEQVSTVSGIIKETATVFGNMEEQMHKIVGIAKQISDISFNLTILSLNASVEAAHAGEYGAGFEVLAGEMRTLSENCTGFSQQVSDVVKELISKVEKASERVESSEEAFDQSKEIMANLTKSFHRLSEQFDVLYSNIEGQNSNVHHMGYMVDDLNGKISNMHNSSLTNQEAVDKIADAMLEFSDNVGKIVKNTQSI